MKLPIGKIICGDCKEILPKFPIGQIKLILTDPPYYKIINDKYDNQWNSEGEFLEFQKNWLSQCINLLSDTGSLYFFGSLKNNILLKTKIWLDKNLIFRNWITWNKPVRMQSGKLNYVNRREEILYYTKSHNFFFCNPRGLRYMKGNSGFSCKHMEYLRNNEPPYNRSIIKSIQDQIVLTAKKRNWKNKSLNLRKMVNINGRLIGNIISHISDKTGNVGSRGKKIHKAEKPVELMKIFIKASTKKDDIVLDPFVGSGTTCVAAEQLGRRWIGIEINKEYCEIARKKIDYEKRNPGFRIFK